MGGTGNGQSGEDRLIDRFFRSIATHPGAFRLLDDAAAVTPPAGSDLVLKSDSIVGGVHFFPDDPAEAVAKKSLRVNLSDLAAKGAEPLGFLLALALPADTTEEWLASFARGLGADAEEYRCPLFGGDTSRTSGPVTVSIAAFGHVPHGTMVRRSGAKAGDLVVVTGTVGDAALGLQMRGAAGGAAFAKLGDGARAHLADRYLLPRPRIALARAVRENASASIDISDGLVGDLAKLAAASEVGARIETGKVPFSPAAQAVIAAAPEMLGTAITGGDDYEIAATVPEARLGALRKAASEARIEVTTIGRITDGEGVETIGPDGQAMALRRTSFSHF